MKYGCCTNMANYELLEKLGYDYIELAGNSISQMSEEEFAKVKETIQKGKVKCCGFNAALTPDVAIVGEDYDLEKARDYARKLCKRGSELGISAIGIGSPKSRHFKEGDNLETAWQQAKDFVEMFAQEAEPYGLTVMWESLNHTESQFGLRIREGADLAKELGRSNVKIVFDIYHMYMEQEEMEELLYSLPYVNHVHIAERVGEERRYPSAALRPYYKELLRPVVRSGYQGAISTEAFDGDVAEGAQRSIELLKGIVEELEKEC